MGKETGAGSEERLNNTVERLTRIYGSITELNREANRIRVHIKDFDVNVEALNMLANARSRDEQGGGMQVLQDLIRYARQTGTQIEAYEGEGALQTPDDSIPLAVEKSIEVSGDRESRGLLKLLSQLAAALAVTLGLFVLIH